MNEYNVYENGDNDGRRVIEQSKNERSTSDQKKEEEVKKARMDRCRRRAERKVKCRCKSGTRSYRRTRVRVKKIISQNPFIIFYLEMYFKSPEKRVTEVARQAGKEWCSLPDTERAKYIRLAERERKRRRRAGIKRRRRRRGTRRRRRRA